MRSIRDFFFAILFSALLAAASQAQSNSGLDPDIGNPGLGGRNSIQGRIYYPSGQPLNKRVRVRVSSVRGGASSIMAGDTGSFLNNGLTGWARWITGRPGTQYGKAKQARASI